MKTQWYRNDAKAKSIIVQCLTDKHLDLVKDSKTAKDMKVLQNVFERNSTFTKLSKDMKVLLKRKLLSLKCSVNEKLEDHFLKFDTIIRELEGVGCKMDESDKVCHLLLSMNENYDTVITAIETISLDTVNMEVVKSRLLNEELKLSSKNKVLAQNDEVSFNASITCFICKKRGHKAAECWTKTNNRGRAFKSYRKATFGGRLHSDGPSTNAHEAETKVSFVTANLWHRRLGHLNRHAMKVLGLPVAENKCEQCMQGKTTNNVFKSKGHYHSTKLLYGSDRIEEMSRNTRLTKVIVTVSISQFPK
ncbi:hypothetical protein QE152_g34249 [Popillia japonica]|uniref:CCHC-type domain-containing protein n=1 Tax=Popillia japonica TaxID=7064 RepID=A0AAW1IU32_POPJA